MPLGIIVSTTARTTPSLFPSYHVRSHQTVAEVLAGEAKAQRQEDIVLEWFKGHPTIRATPSEVWRWEVLGTWPLTSVRRAITNLTKRGWLVHYKADRRPGPYGANESTWGLAPMEATCRT